MGDGGFILSKFLLLFAFGLELSSFLDSSLFALVPKTFTPLNACGVLFNRGSTQNLEPGTFYSIAS
jgi:hypothetical protein